MSPANEHVRFCFVDTSAYEINEFASAAHVQSTPVRVLIWREGFRTHQCPRASSQLLRRCAAAGRTQGRRRHPPAPARPASGRCPPWSVGYFRMMNAIRYAPTILPMKSNTFGVIPTGLSHAIATMRRTKVRMRGKGSFCIISFSNLDREGSDDGHQGTSSRPAWDQGFVPRLSLLDPTGQILPKTIS
jgi:hypothetical protein